MRCSQEGPRSENEDSTGPLTVLFYHRSLGDTKHGETIYVRQVCDLLRSAGPITIVTPPAELTLTNGSALSAGLGRIARTTTAQVRWVLGMRRRRGRIGAMLVADAYAGLLPALLAKCARLPLAYIASDPPGAYLDSLRSGGIRGGWLVWAVRLPVEWLLRQSASLYIVRSEWMKEELQKAGIPPEKLAVLHHRPQSEAPDLDRIIALRENLGVRGRVPIVLAGNFGYPPNRETADFVLQDLAPKLSEGCPEAVVLLVGPGLRRLGRNPPPNVLVVGPVDRLSDYLYLSSIGIAPSQVAGGTSAKTLDYLAHGLVCLVTPEVARTVPHDENLVVAARPEFVDVLTRLCQRVGVPALTQEFCSERYRAGKEYLSRAVSNSEALIKEIQSLLRR